MRKFTKIGLSLAGIFFALGLVFCMLAWCLGSSWSSIWNSVNEGKFNIPGNGWNVNIGNVSVGLAGGNETQKEAFTVTDVKKIHADVDMGDIRFVVGNNHDEVVVSMTKGFVKHYECKIQDGTLNIIYDTGNINYKNGPNIEISVPEGMNIEKIDAHTQLGDIDFDNVVCSADTFELVTNLGDVTFTDAKINGNLHAETDLGDVKLVDGNFEEVELLSHLGDIKINACVNGSVTGETDMGDIKAEFEGEVTDYNYVLDTSMGDIHFNGKKVKSSMSAHMEEENHHATYTIDLSSSMGDVKVDTK